MPVSRPLAETLVDTLTQLVRGTETQLAYWLARRARADIRAGDAERLTALTKLREHTQALLNRLEMRSREEILRAVLRGYMRGSQAALRDITRLGSNTPAAWTEQRSVMVRALTRLLRLTRQRDVNLAHEITEIREALPGVDAMLVLAGEFAQRMSSTHLHVLRWMDDAYRDVMAQPTVDVLAGTTTRLRAAQVAWEHLLSRGITGFTDRSGRNWDLASYVEMAARTTVAQAAVEGHLDRLADAGLDLVIVSNAPQECVRCRPWEGRVLARSGPTGRTRVPSALSDRPVTVDVAGTVTQAITAGLLHPNCRHSLSAYLPGMTRAPTHTADPEGDEDRQRLRTLERRLRKAKRAAETTIDPAAEPALRKRVRDLQAQIRDHVAATGLHRQRQREQINQAR